MPRLDAPRPKRRRRWLLLGAALLALPLALKVLGFEPRNRASTREDHPDATLRPRFYAREPREVQAQVLEALPALSTYGRAWRVAEQSFDEADGSGIVRCEVPVVVFTDDLTVRIEAEGAGSRVHIESASRVGKGDGGENERHVRQILQALDERMS